MCYPYGLLTCLFFCFSLPLTYVWFFLVFPLFFFFNNIKRGWSFKNKMGKHVLMCAKLRPSVLPSSRQTFPRQDKRKKRDQKARRRRRAKKEKQDESNHGDILTPRARTEQQSCHSNFRRRETVNVGRGDQRDETDALKMSAKGKDQLEPRRIEILERGLQLRGETAKSMSASHREHATLSHFSHVCRRKNPARADRYPLLSRSSPGLGLPVF